MKSRRECQRQDDELLKEMEKNKGELLRGDTMSPRENTPKLKDLGIEKKQSMRWQQIAESHGEAKAW